MNFEEGTSANERKSSSCMSKCKYEILIDSQPQDSANTATDLRSWFISIRVTVEGVEVDLQDNMESCIVSGTCERISVQYIGLVDTHCAVYLVSELSRIVVQEDLHCRISILPKYHPNSKSIFKLNASLAQFVGRQYLSKPKYALTLIHAYARENKLTTKKKIICDQTLQTLFGRTSIRLCNIWNELSKLVKVVPEERLVVDQALDMKNTRSTSSVDILIDNGRNLFPVCWSLRGQFKTSGRKALNIFRSEFMEKSNDKVRRLKRYQSF